MNSRRDNLFSFEISFRRWGLSFNFWDAGLFSPSYREAVDRSVPIYKYLTKRFLTILRNSVMSQNLREYVEVLEPSLTKSWRYRGVGKTRRDGPLRWNRGMRGVI